MGRHKLLHVITERVNCAPREGVRFFVCGGLVYK